MAKNFSKSKRPPPVKTRKQIRQEKRQLKKVKRNEYYLNKNKAKHVINEVENAIVEPLGKRKPKISENDFSSSNRSTAMEKQMKERQKETSRFRNLQKEMKIERIRQMKEANEDEDKAIRNLEKKLKLNRRKSKSLPKSFVTEGLDYLLEVCDFDKYKDSINLEKELHETGHDFENDFAIATGLSKTQSKNEDEFSNDEDEIDSENASESSYCEENEESDAEELRVSRNKNTKPTKKCVSFELNEEDKVKNSKPVKRSVSERMKKLQEFVKSKNSNDTACGTEDDEATDEDSVESSCDSKTKRNQSLKKQVTFNLKNEKKEKNQPLKEDASTRMKKLRKFIESQSSNNTASVNEDSKSDDEDDNSINNYHSSCEDSEDSSQKRKKSSSEKSRKKFKEDIYGRLRDEDGNIVENTGKYVPPHLRVRLNNAIPQNSEVLQRLTKQMKGLLNRLTESNMHSISSQMEDLYMKNSRNDTNYVFMKLLSESLIMPVLSPDRIVIEHALLISVLHANIGTELGAYILQHLVEELHKMLEENVPVENKRVDNTIMLLSHLYNFKIFHACLMYEILNKLVNRFCEKDIELILSILRSVGFSLRKDDPTALKELICNIQKKANESTELRESSRVRFMVDILLAVKNNNMLKIPNYDPSYVEHLKKIQKSLLRNGKYVSELNISMEDLLNADDQGRWWIVGSAWSGNLDKKSNKKETNNDTSAVFYDAKILNLARKHRMNTDTRKNIFCILMTAEDYVEAFEKLMKLGLKGQQYQEIIYVLMHCLLKEKNYNPYYAFIAEQFCNVDRKYQLAIQFSTWDKLKEINALSDQQVTNLAKFLTYLLLELKLPLSILKILQFTEMTKPMVKLIRQIMLAVLLTDNESLVVNVFSRISKSEKLFALREGLQLFLHHFILKNIEANITNDFGEKLSLLPKRVEIAVNAMTQISTNEF